ncbi:hypothetical protein VNO78_07874 [Psophocarpus tetragonolobus]|uniref:Uncharacterized protein n=1 Tax=Psophocarpus tetragonolobus TaxID=3891 RepID=A0AAN9XT58_PSOTE
MTLLSKFDVDSYDLLDVIEGEIVNEDEGQGGAGETLAGGVNKEPSNPRQSTRRFEDERAKVVEQALMAEKHPVDLRKKYTWRAF